MDISRELIALQRLREAIAGAGLMACVRFDTMSCLSAFTNWYGWSSTTSTGYVWDDDTKARAMTTQIPLSHAREMLQRAEQTVVNKVSEALQ